MDGFVVGGHAGLLEGLAEGRVGVTGSADVLAGGAVLHSQHALGDHLPGVRPDDVHSEYSVRLLVGQDLDHALVLADALCPAVGGEGKHSLVVRHLCWSQRLTQLGVRDVHSRP